MGEEEDVREDEEDAEDAEDHNQNHCNCSFSINCIYCTVLPQAFSPAPSQQFKPIKSFRNSSFLAL